jgi:hypothetical protein
VDFKSVSSGNARSSPTPRILKPAASDPVDSTPVISLARGVLPVGFKSKEINGEAVKRGPATP